MIALIGHRPSSRETATLELSSLPSNENPPPAAPSCGAVTRAIRLRRRRYCLWRGEGAASTPRGPAVGIATSAPTASAAAAAHAHAAAAAAAAARRRRRSVAGRPPRDATDGASSAPHRHERPLRSSPVAPPTRSSRRGRAAAPRIVAAAMSERGPPVSPSHLARFKKMGEKKKGRPARGAALLPPAPGLAAPAVPHAPSLPSPTAPPVVAGRAERGVARGGRVPPRQHAGLAGLAPPPLPAAPCLLLRPPRGDAEPRENRPQPPRRLLRRRARDAARKRRPAGRSRTRASLPPTVTECEREEMFAIARAPGNSYTGWVATPRVALGTVPKHFLQINEIIILLRSTNLPW